jgi:hypothetical protein
MAYTERRSEVMNPILFEPADSFAISTRNSAWGNMENYHRGWLVLIVGDMAGGATLDCLLREATDVLGTGAQAIAGKAITQLTQAGGDGNDIICIELQTEEMDSANNYDFIGVRCIIAGAAVEYAYVFFACESRYNPVAATQWTEIIG